MPVPGYAIEDRLHRLRVHQRRSAPAHENAGDGSGPGKIAHCRHFLQEGGDETGLLHRRVADVAVEIAIGAFRRAERPVHIDPETGVHSVTDR